MRALLALLLVAACGAPRPFVGAWEIAPAEVREFVASMPADLAAEAEEAYGATSLTFHPDGRLGWTSPYYGAAAEGRWRLVRADGDAYVLELENPESDLGVERAEQVVTVDGDVLTMTVAGREMTFVRRR